MFQWLKKLGSRNDLRQAYQAAEFGNFSAAVELLKRGSASDPNNANIWNELAYCYGKLGQFNDGERAARQAIKLDPANPKFRNGLVGVILDSCWSLTSCDELRATLSRAAPELTAMLQFSGYAPAMLSQALYLALSGKPEAEWNGALIMAGAYYALAASPLERTRSILESKRFECQNASEFSRQLCTNDNALLQNVRAPIGHDVVQIEHTKFWNTKVELVRQAWLASLQHNLADPVILLIDLEDELGRTLVEVRDRAGNRSSDYDSYIRQCASEGRRPAVCFPESRTVVKSWFDNSLPAIGEALNRSPSEKHFYTIILSPGGQSVVVNPISRLGIGSSGNAG